MPLSAIRPVDIQAHLYASFLQGHTADVVLRISGRWKALYRLHRVVLIQADFFRSLFIAGFLESSTQTRPRHRGVEEIDITFDDSNITRAAFEICISRLYGGGPPLHVYSALIPTIAQPLTPSLYTSLESELVPDGHHPATPRLLLSVLATAIYLCIPTVASQALSLVFKTLGPHTVVPYLNFALGKSIDTPYPILPDPEAAVGLEHVAEILEDDPTSSGVSIAEGDFSYIPAQSPQPSNVSEGSFVESSESDFQGDTSSERSSYHNYGPISDKIGEACACWLTRWAKDMLDLELEQSSAAPITDTKVSKLPEKPVIWRRGGLEPTWVAAVVAADTLFVKSERERYDLARAIVELRRRDGVIDSEEQQWTKMFEEAIYYENMSVEELFTIAQDKSMITGTAFAPMSILHIAHWRQSMLQQHMMPKPKSPTQSKDQSLPSPTSKDREQLGLASTTSELRLKATSTQGPDAQLVYPVPGDSSWRMGDNGDEGSTTTASSAVSMDDLFSFSHSPCAASARQTSSVRTGTRKVSTDKDAGISSTESTFFGLKRERYPPQECIARDPNSKRRWTPFPPCRFGVEFWDIDALKEKSRLHSQTVWYAGSLFNVYLQVVKRKGQTQLGIYLYRQSTVEPVPPASAPSPLTDGRLSTKPESESEATPNQSSRQIPYQLSSSPVADRPRLHRGISVASFGTSPPRSATMGSSVSNRSILPNFSSSISPPTTPSSMPSTIPVTPQSAPPSTALTLPYTGPPVSPQQPYRDPRGSISAYFMISCASATGSSQMRFTSSPDTFSVGQSWGWKTSSLRTEEYMEVGENATTSENRTAVNSLRATVVLGLI